jgi:hypothetical protein
MVMAVTRNKRQPEKSLHFKKSHATAEEAAAVKNEKLVALLKKLDVKVASPS